MRTVTKIDNNNLDTIGKRITYERTALGISQQELANRLSMKQQKLSYIESDTPGRNISMQELELLADIFDVSTDYLLGRVSSKKRDNYEISNILGLNDKVISEILNIKNNKRSGLANDLINEMHFGSNLDSILRNIAEYMNLKSILENIAIIDKTIKSKYPVNSLSVEDKITINDNWKFFNSIFNSYKLPILDVININEEINNIQNMMSNLENISINWILVLEELISKLENAMNLLLFETNEVLSKSIKKLAEKNNTYFCEDYYRKIIEG